MNRLVLPNRFVDQPQWYALPSEDFSSLQSLVLIGPGGTARDLLHTSNNATYTNISSFIGVNGSQMAGSSGGTGDIKLAGICSSTGAFSRVTVVHLISIADNDTLSISTQTTSNGGSMWAITAAGEMRLLKSNKVLMGTSSGMGIPTGKPVTLGISYDGTVITGFINGRKFSLGSNTQTFAADASGGTLLAWNSGNRIKGYMSVHADFNTALSDAQMVELTRNPYQLFKSPKRNLWLNAASGGSIVLSDNSITSSTGIPVASLALPISGSSVTGSTGVVTPSSSLAIAGNSSTVSTGTPVASITLTLSGNASTASSGSLSVPVTLVGNSVTTSAGVPVASITLTLSGNSVTSSAGVPVASITLTLSGNSVTSSSGTLSLPSVLVLQDSQVNTSSGPLTPSISLALSGNASTTSGGTLAPGYLATLNGSSSSASVGALTATLNLSLSGNSSSTSAGAMVPAGNNVTVALSGNQVTSANGVVGWDALTLSQSDINAIANAVWTLALDSGFSSGDLLRLIAAMAAGKVSGAGTGHETFRDVADTKNRIVATVDQVGNRTSITLDAT